MPIIKSFGERLDSGSVGPRQVAANPATKAASPPIAGDRWARNGKTPHVSMLNALNEACNQAAVYRTKCVYSNVGRLQNALGVVGTSDRDRFRFAFHSGPMTHALMCVVMMVPTDLDTAPFETNASGSRLDIYDDTAESSVAGTASFSYGAHPTGSNSTVGFQYLKPLVQYIAIDPDTDYYGKFSDTNVGRTQSVLVFELASLTENNDGYLSQNNTVMTPIVDRDRQLQAELLRSLWRRGGATVLNWSVDDGTAPITIASSTATNIIDTAITTISASSPGPTIDMSNRSRISQPNGVPCVMKAFGSWAAGGGGVTGGSVFIKDSGGSTIASIADAWGATPSWISSAAFNWPASSGKVDLQFSRGAVGGTFSLYAISVFPYEA